MWEALGAGAGTQKQALSHGCYNGDDISQGAYHWRITGCVYQTHTHVSCLAGQDAKKAAPVHILRGPPRAGRRLPTLPHQLPSRATYRPRAPRSCPLAFCHQFSQEHGQTSSLQSLGCRASPCPLSPGSELPREVLWLPQSGCRWLGGGSGVRFTFLGQHRGGQSSRARQHRGQWPTSCAQDSMGQAGGENARQRPGGAPVASGAGYQSIYSMPGRLPGKHSPDKSSSARAKHAWRKECVGVRVF